MQKQVVGKERESLQWQSATVLCRKWAEIIPAARHDDQVIFLNHWMKGKKVKFTFVMEGTGEDIGSSASESSDHPDHEPAASKDSSLEAKSVQTSDDTSKDKQTVPGKQK